MKVAKNIEKRYTLAMYKLFLVVSMCVIVALPSFVQAGAIIRSDEKISVDSTQILKGDFYGLGSVVSISGLAENDVYLAGGTVTVNAPVQQDLTILGGVVQIHGDVGDDLRVIGGEVTLGTVVKGDVVVLGGTLTILSTATVEGDVLFMGGDLTVEGEVVGAIHGSSENIRVNSKVTGDIAYKTTNSLVLGDKAEILGNITYKSKAEVTRAQGAQITGDIRQEVVVAETGIDFLQVFIFQVLALLFIASTVYLIARKQMQSIIKHTLNIPAKSGLVGLGVFVIVPFVSVLLMVSMVGLLVGILLLILYVSALILAVAFAGIVTGYFILQLLTKKTDIPWSTVAIGVVLFCLIGFLPYIGGLLLFAIIMIALGGVSISFYHVIRS